jgi:hypothetical protein
VIVYGRRTIKAARGRGGNHPARAPVIAVTHSVTDAWPGEDSTMSLVTGATESAMTRAIQIAGDKFAALGRPLLLSDEIGLAGHLNSAPAEFDGPEVTRARGFTHLHYRVPEPAGTGQAKG